MRTIIRNATVVLPNETLRTSILFDQQSILAVDAALHTTADVEISAHGLHLLPGVIDDQVHFREPGLTHKEDLVHATRACAKGGVTTFLEMPNTIPNTTTQKHLDEKLGLAAQKSLVNYGFYIGATPTNIDELKNARRTPGIKIFIGSSTGDLLVDDQAALERIFAETSLPICAHCEDESTVRRNKRRFENSNDVADHSRIRDHEAAIIATRRTIDLAVRHHHRFHVLHVSTAAEAKLLSQHHQLITAEACPHHLLFTTDDYARLGTLVQMNPSIKSRDDVTELWAALHDGRIQVVATDHAPHTLEEKRVPFPRSPSGLPAVENSLALMLDQLHQGKCRLDHIARWMSDAPARVWDIQDKGRIEVGYHPDLVLVDLNRSMTIRNAEQQTKCRWSPWHGVTLTGWPVRTWVMGHEVWRDGEFDTSKMGTEATFAHERGGYWGT